MNRLMKLRSYLLANPKVLVVAGLAETAFWVTAVAFLLN